MRLLAITIGLAVLAAGIYHVPAQASDQAFSLSAKKAHAKRHVVRRARPAQHQVACTVFGCQPIPRGCTPTQGYDWRGIPTGFDVIACR